MKQTKMTELSRKPTENAPTIAEDDYQLIEQALLQNPRGRWFLEEYVSRNRPEDTKKLLSAIERIENNLLKTQEESEQAQPPQDDIDPIRMSIIEMSKAIAKTRQEIQSIKADGEADNQIVTATEELDSIVEATETATNTILEAAEEIQEAAWILREAGAQDDQCDKIDNKTTDIYTACSFQDITGQRTTKVVNALCYIENRINAMIDIWGLDTTSSGETNAEKPVETRPDSHLLNGPAKLGEGLAQDSVDEMLSSSPNEEINEAENFDDDDISFEPVDQAASEPSLTPMMQTEEGLVAENGFAAEETADASQALQDPDDLDVIVCETTIDLDEYTQPQDSSEQQDPDFSAFEQTIDEGEGQVQILALQPDADDIDFGELEVTDLDPVNNMESSVPQLNPLADDPAADMAAEFVAVAQEAELPSPVVSDDLMGLTADTTTEDQNIASQDDIELLDDLAPETLTDTQKDTLLS